MYIGFVISVREHAPRRITGTLRKALKCAEQAKHKMEKVVKGIERAIF